MHLYRIYSKVGGVKYLSFSACLCILYAFSGCKLDTNNATLTRHTLMDGADSKMWASYEDDIRTTKKPKRTLSGNANTSFFGRDSLLAQSDLALESELHNNSDFSSQANENLKKAHKAHRQELMNLSGNISKNWGESEFEVSDTSKLVKYSDHYLSRSSIDFTSGKIRVETIDTSNPTNALESAITKALLTPKDPRGMDLYSDSEVKFDGKPFLAGLIKDNEGQDILYEWRAKRYAQYLVQNKLQTRTDSSGHKVYYVDLQMSDDYQKLAGNSYQAIAQRYAKEFGLDPALVMAIIHTESNFNPYAMSHVPAYGLMQIVPSTAGADSHKLITGNAGVPTKTMLFTPETNIRYGSAYLHILFTRYLQGISDPKSQEYCVIAAYNTGSGNVLRAFHSDRKQAISVINSLSSDQVYKRLTTKLSQDEARRYVQKVTNFKRQYVGL